MAYWKNEAQDYTKPYLPKEQKSLKFDFDFQEPQKEIPYKPYWMTFPMDDTGKNIGFIPLCYTEEWIE